MRKFFDAVSARSDVTFAMGLLALGVLEAIVLAHNAPLWPQVPLTFAWSLPLIWRRRRPVPVLGLVILLGPVIGLVNAEGGVTSYALAAILAAYTVGRELDAPSTWWGPAITVDTAGSSSSPRGLCFRTTSLLLCSTEGPGWLVM